MTRSAVPVSLRAPTGTAPMSMHLAASLDPVQLAAAAVAGSREFTALGVPYETEIERHDWAFNTTRLRIARGAMTFRDDAKVFYGHQLHTTPIGAVLEVTDTDDGPQVRAFLAETARADEIRTLMLPGEHGRAVLDKVSLGFYITKYAVEDADTDTPVLVVLAADAFEMSVVPYPAYDGAAVESVLSLSTPPREVPAMPEIPAAPAAPTAEQFSTLAASLDTLERRISTLGASAAGSPGGPAVPGASYGEFLQLAAAADPAALEFLAYVGGTTDDLGAVMKDSWVGDRFRAIEAQRTVLNFFSRSPLPATGMGVEFGVEGLDTTKVEKQAAEGDTLAYGKIKFTTDRAALETYGGWGEMTRQEIERSPINVVERFFGALTRKYAATTEASVNAKAQAAGTVLAGGVLDLATVDGWTKFAIRSARVLKDRGYPLEGLLVGYDVFEDLALLRDGTATDAPRFLDRTTGSINVVGLSGEMFNLPVIPIETGATTKVVRAANAEAIRTYEAPGAPFRLQDDDITNLTKAFSLYGYLASGLEVPGAIVKPATV